MERWNKERKTGERKKEEKGESFKRMEAKPLLGPAGPGILSPDDLPFFKELKCYKNFVATGNAKQFLHERPQSVSHAQEEYKYERPRIA